MDVNDAIVLLKSAPVALVDEQACRNAEDDEPNALVLIDVVTRDQIVALLEAVQSSLKLDAEEMKLAAQEQQNPWTHVPKHYAGRWTYDYDEKNRTFFVCCGGHRILDAEDSEVCDAVCRAHNTQCQTQDVGLCV